MALSAYLQTCLNVNCFFFSVFCGVSCMFGACFLEQCSNCICGMSWMCAVFCDKSQKGKFSVFMLIGPETWKPKAFCPFFSYQFYRLNSAVKENASCGWQFFVFFPTSWKLCIYGVPLEVLLQKLNMGNVTRIRW